MQNAIWQLSEFGWASVKLAIFLRLDQLLR
jgi:hypothetical protein